MTAPHLFLNVSIPEPVTAPHSIFVKVIVPPWPRAAELGELFDYIVGCFPQFEVLAVLAEPEPPQVIGGPEQDTNKYTVMRDEAGYLALTMVDD